MTGFHGPAWNFLEFRQVDSAARGMAPHHRLTSLFTYIFELRVKVEFVKYCKWIDRAETPGMKINAKHFPIWSLDPLSKQTLLKPVQCRMFITS